MTTITHETTDLLIHHIQIGPAANFVYLVGDKHSRTLAVVDPAWDPFQIEEEIGRLGFTLAAVLLTHGHSDHTNGLAALLGDRPLPVYLSPHELTQFRPDLGETAAVVVDTQHGAEITLGTLRLRVLHTPGHSPGCQLFHLGRYLISGDTLFIDGCGRCDLPGSDVTAAFHSLHHVIAPLPDDTLILPGHDYGPKPFDTLGNQRQSNRFLRANTLESFIAERMG